MKNTVRIGVRHLIFAFRPSAIAMPITLTMITETMARKNVNP